MILTYFFKEFLSYSGYGGLETLCAIFQRTVCMTYEEERHVTAVLADLDRQRGNIN